MSNADPVVNEGRPRNLVTHDDLASLNWRCHAAHVDEAPVLVCLHPLPHDGGFFDTAAPLLAKRRPVLCPDYPAFGDSPPLPEPWTLEGWANALGAGLASLPTGTPVDLLGFHTGCLVAVEMALRDPGRIGRLVLVDTPYFDPQQRRDLGDQTTHAPRYHGKPVAIQGFRTAFAYDPMPRFRLLEHETLCIGTDSSLHGPSEAAARVLPRARFLSRRDLRAPVFNTGAEAIVECVEAFLLR
jgi:pimeloyl-ACP methyl ester carboxylesterase